MQPQTSLNRNRSPNLNEQGLKGIKPHLTTKRAGFKLSQNKKAGIPLFVIATTLILIIIGLAALFLQSEKAKVFFTKEQIDAVIGKVPVSLTQPDEIRDNNPATTEPESTTENTPPSTGEITQECIIKGEWEQLYIKRKSAFDFIGTTSPMVKSVGVFRYMGTCVADIYLEAGINPSTKGSLTAMPLLSGAVPTNPSWCDNNKNYYGHLWKGVKPNQVLIANFRPVTPMEDGTYKMVVGAYTGCLASKTTDKAISTGGKVIIDNSYDIRISKVLYGATPTLESVEAEQSWERVK